ncbi:hypothetical protein [Embleya sp. NPDC050493]|uniref:hypothetical protein n=1 Tax=Embleya sp. NPDC050493 TaxID=3363989 RepID=UPI0037B1208C
MSTAGTGPQDPNEERWRAMHAFTAVECAAGMCERAASTDHVGAPADIGWATGLAVVIVAIVYALRSMPHD